MTTRNVRQHRWQLGDRVITKYSALVKKVWIVVAFRGDDIIDVVSEEYVVHRGRSTRAFHASAVTAAPERGHPNRA